MKLAANIAGAVLGLAFIAFACMVLFKLVDMPPPPEGTPASHFMSAFGPTGYMTFVKILELAGGILVAIPRTRNWGLLVLGPILVNIIAFHLFVGAGVAGLLDPVLILLCLLAAFLLWAGRKAFLGLLDG
jgi:hypothetical protein